MASRPVIGGVSAALLMALAWGLVGAQDRLTRPEYEATIAALNTQVADLEQQLAEPPASAVPSPTPASPDSTNSVVRGVRLITESGSVTFDVELIDYSDSQTIETLVEDYRARGVFKIIYLEITNTGEFANLFPFGSLNYYGYASSSGDFWDPWADGIILMDSEGRRYSVLKYPTVWFPYEDDDNDNTSEELQPGLTYRFALVFDVPTDVDGLVLRVGSETRYDTIPILE